MKNKIERKIIMTENSFSTSGSGLFIPNCNPSNYNYWKEGDDDDDIHIEDDDYNVDDD